MPKDVLMVIIRDNAITYLPTDSGRVDAKTYLIGDINHVLADFLQSSRVLRLNLVSTIHDVSKLFESGDLPGYAKLPSSFLTHICLEIDSSSVRYRRFLQTPEDGVDCIDHEIPIWTDESCYFSNTSGRFSSMLNRQIMAAVYARGSTQSINNLLNRYGYGNLVWYPLSTVMDGLSHIPTDTSLRDQYLFLKNWYNSNLHPIVQEN